MINGVVLNIKKEIKQVCSVKHSSILADNHEAVKRFSWETIWCELNEQMPVLVHLLSDLVDNPNDKKPMLCLIISMIIVKIFPLLNELFQFFYMEMESLNRYICYNYHGSRIY